MALRRELEEELEFRLTEAQEFVRFEFNMRPLGLGRYFRSYHEILVITPQIDAMVLHEGAKMRWFAGGDALKLKLVPYGSFALFLHYRRTSLSG
jgi:8-oxo-dGTP pyrophosphatase MutT (NUDIX family)